MAGRYDINGLAEAAMFGQLEDVKEHIQNGVNVNGRNWLCRTPLYCATCFGHSEVIEFLISKGAKAYTYNIDGLIVAASYGQLEDVKQHLQNGVDANGRDRYGKTPLECATQKGHSEVIEFLISKGAKGYTYNIDGLINAVEHGRLEDVKQHLQNGVDANGRDRRGRTPLECATCFGHSEVIEFLISKGAKGYTYNIDGLIDAAKRGQLEDVKQHLQNGVDANGADRRGRTPLKCATQNGHSEVIEFLISKGAKGYTYNIYGLFQAVQHGRLEDVKQHLQNRVNVNLRDRNDNTPLNIALRNGHSQVVQLLVSKGATQLDLANCSSLKKVPMKFLIIRVGDPLELASTSSNCR